MPAQAPIGQTTRSAAVIPPGSSRRLWWQRGLGAGLVVSIAVHLLLLLTAAGIYLQRLGGGSSAGGEIELAIMTDAELSELAPQPTSPPVAPATQASAPEAALNPLSDTVAPTETNPTARADVQITGGAGADLGAGLDIEGGAGLGGASFFGVEARGARFVYIVDVSGSMAGDKLETLQIELTDSINALSPGASFAIVLFSTDALPVGGQARWWDASDAAKLAAGREIRAIAARGGTNPLPAFELAFSLSPKPDAIYFMTDGLFADVAAARIAQLNEESGGAITPIHAISFVSREAETLLRAIARRSGGSYTHVQGPGR